ncbi:spherulin-2A-like [Pectinophora gossypiella]|uniref:spherulin-2A-like n=1 Tax=Pectinophora gossypiella TaxID=13191 RepID=UPI00214F5B42|nr:spherulin-2A-like [Pectinophora gossypiella]
MFTKALLLLLPAFAYARISIDIQAGSNEQNAKIEYLGSNVDIISDKERGTWQITDSKLKDAARAYSGGRPDDVYVRSPTPWNDLYTRYGWQQVQRTLLPRNARILGIKTEPVIVSTQEFVNNSTKKASYNAGITQSVEETVSNTWSKGGELTVGQEITYSIKIGVGEVGGTTSISYTSSWGEETTKSKSVTVGSQSGVTIDLDPGQSVQVTLSATRGTMEVQVDYTAHLDGFAACNYSGRYNGHYFWAYDINACLSAAGLPRSVDSSEVIKIGFYSDAKVEVSDKKSNKLLTQFNAAFY